MSPRLARRAAVPAVRRVAPHAAAGTGALASLGPDSRLPPFGQGLADKVPLILFSYDIEARRSCCTATGTATRCWAIPARSCWAWAPTGLTPAARQTTPAQFRTQPTCDTCWPSDRALSWDCRVRHRDGQLALAALAPAGQGAGARWPGARNDGQRRGRDPPPRGRRGAAPQPPPPAPGGGLGAQPHLHLRPARAAQHIHQPAH